MKSKVVTKIEQKDRVFILGLNRIKCRHTLNYNPSWSSYLSVQ